MTFVAALCISDRHLDLSLCQRFRERLNKSTPYAILAPLKRLF